MRGFTVKRPDDNSKYDLLAQKDNTLILLECKRHKAFRWNELIKYYDKLKSTEKLNDTIVKSHSLVFKANNQPVLVMIKTNHGLIVTTFESAYGGTWLNEIPKNYKVWQK